MRSTSPSSDAPPVASVTPELSDENTVDDVKQLGTFAAIASLGYVFWIVGAMEMVERLAYFGVRNVSTLYATDPVSKGGLGVTPDRLASLFGIWAAVQTFLPVFTGSLSDRYGYKESIFASTVLKIAGYLVMAFFPTYSGFAAGAIVLATGTAIFKPGIQGTLAKSCTRKNSSVAWGIFYQTVNIGAFLGPLLAGYLRLLEWHYVFYACSGIISLNFLLLLTYEEVDKAARLAARSAARLTASQGGARESLLLDSIREITKPHVALYLLIFSGFWFMFMALFDVLPMHVRDWVDTSDIVKWWFADGKSTSALFNRFAIVSGDGTRIQPEGIVNINAMMIMATCFLFAGFSARMRATTSMVVGTLLSSVALFMIGQATLGWLCALAIAVFSVGEMLSSPKFLEFIGNIAPSNKKAMYLGFSQLPLGIGWTAEGYFGQKMYHAYASRDRFSMELLSDRIDAGTTSAPDLETLTKLAENAKSVSASELLQLHEKGGASLVEVIPVGERFDWLVAFTGESADSLREVLYRTHDVGMIWNIMAGVGVATAVAIWGYGLWLRGRANRVG